VGAASTSIARLGAGTIVAYVPTPSIEIGVARFFHRNWTGQYGAAELSAPSVRSSTHAASDARQPTAFRVHVDPVPSSGVEIFGEFGKNDRNSSLHDALLEPEHNSAWILGFFDVLGPESLANGFWSVRVERATVV